MYPQFSNIKLNDNIPFDTIANKNNSSTSKNNNIQSQPYVDDFSGSSSNKNDNNLQNNYGDICLDLEAENYPKKYKKFVNELTTLLNCISISNVTLILFTFN
jgi:hypothetical protein